MSIIPFPSCPPIGAIKWRLNQPTQVNRSEWTKRRKVTILASAPMWMAEVPPFDLIGEDMVRAWRVFLTKCRGQANTFRLPAVKASQITGVSPLVNGGGQGGYSILTDAWGADGIKLRAGQFVTINDQLLLLTEDVVAANGGARITFEPHIRYIPADNTPVNVSVPTAIMAMTDDTAGWDDEDFDLFTVGFAAEEAF